MQELRLWQKEWREENENIHRKVDNFWAEKMPEDRERRAALEEEKEKASSRPASGKRPMSGQRPASGKQLTPRSQSPREGSPRLG